MCIRDRYITDKRQEFLDKGFALLFRHFVGKLVFHDFAEDEMCIRDSAYFIHHPERIVHTTAKLDTDPYGCLLYTSHGGTDA